MASVRATISRSGSRRASTAALILATISAAGMTALPSKWPQRLGNTWSSIWIASAPARPRSLTVRTMFMALPKPVSASTISGPGDVGGRKAEISDDAGRKGIAHAGQDDGGPGLEQGSELLAGGGASHGRL